MLRRIHGPCRADAQPRAVGGGLRHRQTSPPSAPSSSAPPRTAARSARPSTAPRPRRRRARPVSPSTASTASALPLFVIHGANDPRVPVGEAEQIVAALRARNQRVEYLRFENEGHGIFRRENRVSAYGALARFFDDVLGR
nr:prolyl oligopeptidase family serine peptidase [Deltaproteobacteria bacterium]